MNILTGRLAQILFSLPMIFFGVNHFISAKKMANMVPLPAGEIWVYISGFCLIAAALAIIAGKFVNLAAFLLGVLIFSFAFILYLPGIINATTQQEMMMPMINMLKDISIASGAWVISGRSKS